MENKCLFEIHMLLLALGKDDTDSSLANFFSSLPFIVVLFVGHWIVSSIVEFHFLGPSLTFPWSRSVLEFCRNNRSSKIMSEESKTPDGDYVMMGSGQPHAAVKSPIGVDDPNLSQEDKDHRLAILLQQQENAAAYDVHKKKHEQITSANVNRTARSGTFTRLAAIRDKDHGMLTVPKDYTTENAYVQSDGAYLPPVAKSDEELLKGATPQQVADFMLAKELQKVEQVGAGTAREMAKIVQEETTELGAQDHRTQRSNYHINQKKLDK